MLGNPDELVKKIEDRLNAQEQLLANLTMGYMEIAVAIEVCLTRIAEPLDEAARKALAVELQSQKQDLIATVQRFAHDTADLGGADAHLGATLGAMATPNFITVPE